jgi:hypothetical protein
MSPPGQKADEIAISIDASSYSLAAQTLTGAQLRELPSPPIPFDRDLFLVAEGGEDRLVESEEVIELRQGTSFFTVPRTIMPGGGSESGCCQAHTNGLITARPT